MTQRAQRNIVTAKLAQAAQRTRKPAKDLSYRRGPADLPHPVAKERDKDGATESFHSFQAPSTRRSVTNWPT